MQVVESIYFSTLLPPLYFVQPLHFTKIIIPHGFRYDSWMMTETNMKQKVSLKH